MDVIQGMPKIAPVSWKVLVRVFELDGFTLARVRGDHRVYTKLTRERYFDLLAHVGGA